MKELPQDSLLPESFIRKSIRIGAKTAAPLSLLTASLIFTACGGVGKNSDSVQPQSASRPNESGALPNPENPFAVLGMPFPKNKDMTIQQGWLYDGIATQDGRKEHNGIDFIKGELNNSRAWKSFSVTAVADGKACANPPSRIGNAVLLTHSIGNTPIGSSYYGHLENSEKDIPECSTGQTVSKRKGDKIGEAGATGAQDKSWIHLHFQVNDANGNSIDPYDLRNEREFYPDPNFKNGKPCGPKALFVDCYSKGVVVASPKDAIPPISGNVKEKSVNPSSSVEKPVEKGWNRFTSTRLQIDYPSNWTTDKDSDDEDEYLSLTLNKNDNAELSIDAQGLEEPENSSLDSFKKRILAEWFGDDRKAYQEIPLVIGGQKVWRIEMEPNPEYVYVLAVTKDRAWRILLSAEGAEDWKTIQTMLASVKFLEPTESKKPTPTSTAEKKTPVEKKVSLSKKPDELYRALLTSPIALNVLPQGISARGISAAEIDATGKALKQVGTVNILIEDSVLKTSGGIGYAIFPDSSTAKSASELIGTHLGDGQVLKDFPYPAKIYATANLFGGITTILIASAENVIVVTSLTGADARGVNANLAHSRAISLAHAAIEHLGKVGK